MTDYDLCIKTFFCTRTVRLFEVLCLRQQKILVMLTPSMCLGGAYRVNTSDKAVLIMEDVTSRKRGPVCVDTVEGMRSGKFLRIDDKCAVGQDPLTEGETPQSASLSVSCVDTEASSGRLAVVSGGFHFA